MFIFNKQIIITKLFEFNVHHFWYNIEIFKMFKQIISTNGPFNLKDKIIESSILWNLLPVNNICLKYVNMYISMCKKLT